MEFFANPWVIGIGTAVIAALISYLILHFVFGIGKPKPKHGQIATSIQDKNHSTPLPLPGESATNHITPAGIRDYLDSLPPLQRDSAADYYKGIRVSWTLNLQSAYTLSNGKLHLMMLSQGHYPWVYCDVDPDQYPILRVIKSTQLFTVEGEIEAFEMGGIMLKNCRFLF